MPKRVGIVLLWLMGVAVAAAWFLSPPAMAGEIPIQIASPTGARPVAVKAGSTVTVAFEYQTVGVNGSLRGVVELSNAQNTPVVRVALNSLQTGGIRKEIGVTLPAGTSDGLYNLKVQIESYNPFFPGGWSRGVALEREAVIVDNQPPRLGAFAPKPDEVVGSTRPTIAARMDDAVRAELVVNGAAIPASAFSISEGVLRYLPASPLPQGANTVALTAIDRAGNTSTLTTWSFTVDTVPPSVEASVPAPETVVDNPNTRIAARISDATPTTYTFKVAGRDVTSETTINGEEVSYLPAVPLPSGRVAVEVVAVDAAGNRGEQQWGFVVDTGGPRAKLTADTQVVNGAGPDTIKIRAEALDDNPASAGLAIKQVGTADWIPLVERVGVEGAFEYMLATDRLASDGQYTVRLIVRDSLGLTDVDQFEILVDRTAPLFTEFKPGANSVLEFNRATIYFGFAGADTFHIQVDGQPVDQEQVAVVEVPGGKKAVYAPETPFEAGKQHHVKVVLADAAGNTTLQESSFTVLSNRRGFGFGRLWFE
ncbi:MAG: Ig-like domain-containing protein [Syntrophothermus sp.]